MLCTPMLTRFIPAARSSAATGVGKVVGVAFGRYLGVAADGICGGDGVQYPAHVSGGQVGRRASAQENGVHRRPAQRRGPGRNFPGYRSEEIAELRFNALVRVEIAVGALGQAERDMDVQRDAVLLHNPPR